MRATILPRAIILTKAHRAAVTMMAMWCILPPLCFLYLFPNYIQVFINYNAVFSIS